MTEALILTTSSLTAFFAHDFIEKRITDNGKKQVRLIIKNYHIHHSFFGLLSIFCGLILVSGGLVYLFLGYGIGNIWQHKKTHERVKEKGFVFISKIKL